MKTIINPLLTVFAILLSLQACIRSEVPTARTKADEPTNMYFIQQSCAGKSSRLFDLKPFKAFMTVNKGKDELAEIAIVYDFLIEGANEFSTFSLNCESVPTNAEESTLVVNAQDVYGFCCIKGERASFIDGTLSGFFGPEDATLSFSGTINGYPFSLDINAAVKDETSFIPEYLNAVIIDYMSFCEMVITNDTADNVDLSVFGGDEAIDSALHIRSGETQLIQLFVENYPEDVSIEIIYGNGEKARVSGQDFWNNPIFHKKGAERSWFLVSSETGGIDSIPFVRELFSISPM